MIISRRISELLVFICTLSCTATHAQHDLLYCEFYTNMEDFLEGDSVNYAAIGELIVQSDRLVSFKKFINPDSGKKDKNARYAWALELDSTPYLNLAFTKELYQKGTFIQLDFKGRYCVATIRKDESYLGWSSESLVVTGVAGKAISEMRGIRFADSLGVKHSVIYVDTEEIFTEPFSGNTGGMGKLVTYDR